METIYNTILSLGNEIEEELVNMRRDFHRHPETGWTEMRTSAIVVEKLSQLGYQVYSGRDVCREEDRMGVPEAEILRDHYEQILKEKDRVADYITDDMKEGFTGAVGVLECGEGPTVALRFDIDALPMQEDLTEEHLPYREGFASVYPGKMHACGHDCHTAIGLGVAKLLAEIKDQLHGTIRLLFQPAEEGTRGACSMVKAGWLDGVDYFITGHVSKHFGDETAELIPGSYGALATCKYKVTFKGCAAHAGRSPEEGRNAVMAAAHAAVGLSGISRHSEGMSRINVGAIHGGEGTNVVPDTAILRMEVRGETTDINNYMMKRAEEICRAAAMMEDCQCRIEMVGHAPSETSDEQLVERIAEICANNLPYRINEVHQVKNIDSEDAGFMMERVQKNGGQAVYMRLITSMVSPQHTVRFDIDESVLSRSCIIYTSIIANLLK